MDESLSGFCIRNGSVRSNNSGTKCGRWNPTTEQVKLLTELFSSGLRTPSTDQIQKISTQLSFYGKIESKNVFYWFQNHKARERQKRRKVSFDDKDVTQREKSTTMNSPTQNFAQLSEVSEPKKEIETLQLFPLNSFGESESKNLRVRANECRDNMFSYTMGEQMVHPPLDLRLSFLLGTWKIHSCLSSGRCTRIISSRRPVASLRDSHARELVTYKGKPIMKFLDHITGLGYEALP